MKRTIIIIIWATSVIASFYIGANIGAREFWFADAQYQASITAGKLRLIEKDRTHDLKTALEIELNENIARHGNFLDSNFEWLWSIKYGGETKAIQSAVAYRNSHPFEEPDLSDPKNWKSDFELLDLKDPFMQDVIDGQAEQQKQFQFVIEKYTTK